MGNIEDTRIVLGSLRFKGSPDTDISIPINLEQTAKQQVEYERSYNLGLDGVFDNERENSVFFRPTCKFSIIFKNAYSGATIGNPPYAPFDENLYYVNEIESVTQRCDGNSNYPWKGYPLYNEFDFIRNDYNVPGYTVPNLSGRYHVPFVAKSAHTYNWNFFVSYPFQNIGNKLMIATVEIPTETTPVIRTIVFNAEDGIPFAIRKRLFNGFGIIEFRCPVKHGMKVGESFKTSTNFKYLGNDVYQIFSLGDGAYGSDEYIFNIVDIGYTGTTFNSYGYGTAKRIVNRNNVQDTLSKYYVRRHKIITKLEDINVTKTGFEQTSFRNIKKYFNSPYTPDYRSRIAVKEGSQAYTLTMNDPINLLNLIDNQKRPVSELFFTVMWKGYFGWTMIPKTTGFVPLKQGWGFNLNQINNQPNTWWDNILPLSYTTFPVSTYTKRINSVDYTFAYVETLKEGDELDGDFCEWNDFEQEERVISNLYHKFNFNPRLFNINQNNETTNTNMRGYYYQPHHSVKIRVFSDYIEESERNNSANVPNYAYYSTTTNTFRYRDIYPYGFLDDRDRGVTYPFLNGIHYPYENFVFRIIPEGTTYNEQTIVPDPTTDECE